MSDPKPRKDSGITVEGLIRHLQGHAKHKPICFGGSPDGLSFHRVKDRGDFVQIEFNEQVYRDSSGRIVVEEF